MRRMCFGLLLVATATGAAAQEAAHRAEFNKRDANNDGRLSQDEYAGHPGNFRALDCNHDGVLSEPEFVNRNCNAAPSADMRDLAPADAFAQMDRNRDGVIASGEWRGAPEDFGRLDRNGDGVITGREYSNLPAATPEEARFDRADLDGDGVLDRREWPDRGEFELVDRNRDQVVTLQEFLNAPPGDFREARFEEMDHNDDGVVSRWEWHGDAAGFEQRDRNDDGVVTEREFSHIEPSGSTSDAQFRQLDRDRDGRISRREWRGDAESFLMLDQNRDGWLGLSEYVRTRPLDRRFRLLDQNGDGVISRSEWHGERAAFARLDRDRNGVLSRHEFQF